ncbi:MAG: helical backbone metal receptor [Bacteroidia bacterium]
MVQRIISVVPSQTELLFDLGLEQHVAGITWFCERPADKVKQVPKIGGTKNLKVDKILSLKPDLVIANKEENEKEQIEELARHVPVWTSDVNDLPSALEMIREVGRLCDKQEEAEEMAAKIAAGFAELRPASTERTAYLIWRQPWMTVGRDTFIHDVMERAGYKNIYSRKIRYPETSLEELAASEPEVILLSSEPFPFKQKHVEEVLQAIPSARVELTDGQVFSWYGSRLLQSIEVLKKLRLAA